MAANQTVFMASRLTLTAVRPNKLPMMTRTMVFLNLAACLFVFLIHSGCSSSQIESFGLNSRPSNTTCLAPVDPGVNDANIPELLSQTGCVVADNPAQAATGLIPYTVNIPLWSDGAVKQRWMALPDDEIVQVLDDGNWLFPKGTILQKNFYVDGQLIETRHLIYFLDGNWAGYTYEWNEEETEATLVGTSGKDRVLSNGQVWFYPGRFHCLICHNQESGTTLSPKTEQMNRLFTYPSTGIESNQIETLRAIGVIDLGSEIDVDTLPKFPEQTGVVPSGAELEESARGYLATNCAICHRPGGIGAGPEDFRAFISFAEMNVCDVLPTAGDLGIPDARLLAPGEPERSVLWKRMSVLDINRMPPLASNVVDSFGLDLIGAWIQGVTACPVK